MAGEEGITPLRLAARLSPPTVLLEYLRGGETFHRDIEFNVEPLVAAVADDVAAALRKAFSEFRSDVAVPDASVRASPVSVCL